MIGHFLQLSKRRAAPLIARLCVGLSTWWLLGAVQAMSFVHPAPEAARDQRHDYYWEMLNAALAANRDQFGDFTVRAHPRAMTFPRAVAEVASGKGLVNIIARATNLELERQLLPVRIPLDKGLLGARLFLVTPATQARLDQISTLDELRQFTIGQSPHWTDTPILQDAGFRLVLSDNYPSLFQMLGAGRFDLFSRGAIEIGAELEAHRAAVPGMAIERRFLLHYPMPRYFFVPRTAEGEAMAVRIADGLRRLRASGEFERRYQAYKRLVLKSLDLSGRIVFRLPNSQLSAEAPLNDRFWWDDLSAELGARRQP